MGLTLSLFQVLFLNQFAEFPCQERIMIYSHYFQHLRDSKFLMLITLTTRGGKKKKKRCLPVVNSCSLIGNTRWDKSIKGIRYQSDQQVTSSHNAMQHFGGWLCANLIGQRPVKLWPLQICFVCFLCQTCFLFLLARQTHHSYLFFYIWDLSGCLEKYDNERHLGIPSTFYLETSASLLGTS